MPDPLVGWLSHVGQLLTLVAHISDSLVQILRNAVLVLGPVLTACNYLWRFTIPRKRVAGRRAEKKGSQGRGTPT